MSKKNGTRTRHSLLNKLPRPIATTMSFHRLSLAAACLALLLSSSPASADDAASLFGEGLRLYAEKKYEESAVALSAAYDAKPDQQTLFAWAQAVRLSGDCDKSRELFAKYVANGANSKQSKAAFKLMEDCTPAKVVKPEVPVEETPPETNSAPQDGAEKNVVNPSPPPAADGATPWYKDWVAVGLFSVGAVGLGVSGLSYSNALQLETDGMQSGVSYDRFLELKQQSQDSRTLALVTGVGGALLIGAGVTYLLVRDTSPSRESSAVSVRLDGDSASFAISGHF